MFWKGSAYAQHVGGGMQKTEVEFYEFYLRFLPQFFTKKKDKVRNSESQLTFFFLT
jgi:hypothetical protein